MCVCICERVCLCVYRYVCVCVGLCNTQEHPGLPDTLWFYPESRMGISQKCWVLQSKADNCYLTKNLGAFKLKRTFLCTREWWLQYLKCWDPPWCQFGYVSHQIWTNYVIWVEHRGFNTLSIIAIDRAAIILQSVFPYQTLLKSALIQRIQTGGVKQKRTKYKENLKVQLFSFILYGDKKLYSVTSMLLAYHTMHIRLPEIERKCSWN